MSCKERRCGVLMPVFSLPSPYGIGCFSKEAYRFVDWLAESDQQIWQILPLSPTSIGDSPYQSVSAFGGNPYFIDLDELIGEGLLSRRECDEALGDAPSHRVDYGLQFERRLPLLRLAHHRFSSGGGRLCADFLDREGGWVYDYAEFMAKKEQNGGRPFWEWKEPRGEPDPQEVEFYLFLQERFYGGWERLHRYASEAGITILGDLPLYVSADSADVWSRPELFCLSEDGRPRRVAGCPPDEFSPTGQLWGNPLYRWEAHRGEDYAWWLSRLSHAFGLYDGVRLDHFRGFDAYYSIPAGAADATEGVWKPGPGYELFRVAEELLGKRWFVAEDLGFMTESAMKLVKDCAFPGMKILQFGFEEDDFSSEDLPHRYPCETAAYPGTHDNETLTGWLCRIDQARRQRVCTYLQLPEDTRTEVLASSLLGCLFRSQADLCIVPLSDHLGLGNEARINTPGREGGNWQWRVSAEALGRELSEKMKTLARVGGR